jgi:hypothetical protein
MFCYCILKDIPLEFNQSYIDLCRERICLSIMKNIAIGFDNELVSVVALKDSTNNDVDQENVPPTVNNPPSAKTFSLKGGLRNAKTANKCIVGAADDKSEVSNCKQLSFLDVWVQQPYSYSR